MNIEDRIGIAKLFEDHNFQYVAHLAAQAGVRYSIENPSIYIDTNIVGFTNILEGCRQNNIKHLVYASSSSTYGLNTKQPYSTHESVNHPISLYAATKKANELIAHSYSHLYNIPTTGLRFFTVYGPFDRPDMALQKFTNAIINDELINVFNFGKHKRDFTYIDDIVEGMIRVLDKPATSNQDWDSSNPDPATSSAPFRLYNIGNNNPIILMDYIKALESSLGKIGNKKLLPIQSGDVPDTYADVDDLVEQFNFKPSMSLDQGIDNFVSWFKDYYHINI
jgi:UDP-glucuronate 4-epimerase